MMKKFCETNSIIVFLLLTVVFYTAVFCEETLKLKGDFPLVHCETSKGPLTIEVHRDWSPLGADRFIELVQDDFFTDIAFFRCVEGFLTQFGISDNPKMKHWHNAVIQDDPNLHLGIKKHVISYAGGGANTRSTQLFIAFEDLDFLGNEPWETPFGTVIEGEATLRALYKGYGDIPPFGRGPDQQKIHNQGNAYVRRNFPKTDFIQSCELVYLPREPEQIVTKPAADAEIAAEIAEELSLAESTSESTLAAASSNSEEIPEPIYRLGDGEKKSGPVAAARVRARGLEVGEKQGGESFISNSHVAEAEADGGLMFKAVAFLSLLFLYILVSRVFFNQGGGGGGVIKVQ